MGIYGNLVNMAVDHAGIQVEPDAGNLMAMSFAQRWRSKLLLLVQNFLAQI